MAIFGLALGGCAGKTSSRAAGIHPTVAETLAAYRTALANDDPASAYRLLTPSLRQRVSIEQFRLDWQENRTERTIQLQQLQQAGEARKPSGPSSSPLGPIPASRAVVALPQGTELALSLSPASPAKAGRTLHPQSSWQIVDPDLSALHAGSPEQLLELLVAAVQQRNYFAILRLLSTAERQAIEAELRERVDRLRGSLSKRQALPIEVHGNRARYHYDPRFFIDLVREEGGWRILDLN